MSRRRLREDIRVTVSHPVPVPQAPRRPDASPTLGYTNAETPVTIRHVPLRALDLAELRLGRNLDTRPFRYARHAGRLWAPLPRIDGTYTWGADGEDWLARLPLPAFTNIHNAASASRFTVGCAWFLLARQPGDSGTPFAVRSLPGVSETVSPPLPGRAPLADLDACCRAAVRSYADTALIHDGEVLYRALSRPRLHAGDLRCITRPGQAPDPVDPGFPPEEVETYIEWLRGPALGRSRPTYAAGKLREVAAEILAIHDAPDPVAEVIEDATAAALYVAEAARHVVRRGGRIGIEVRRHITAFWPTLAAASVTAIGPDMVDDTLVRTRALAAYVAAEHPTAARRAHMEGVVDVIDRVVRPRLANAVPVPKDDAEAVASLGL